MPIPNTRPLDRSFMRDEVFELLRGWIVDGTLQAGEKLRDKELAEQLGVSRTPVREALRKLEDDGLVETAPNRYTRVSLLDIKEAEEIYSIIEALEQLALTSAFGRLGVVEIDRLWAANQRFAAALEGQDPVAATAADDAFHAVIIHAAQNTELSNLLAGLKAKSRRFEIAYFEDAASGVVSIREHAQLIEALGQGDLPAAQQLLQTNWLNSIARLLTAGSKIGPLSKSGPIQ